MGALDVLFGLSALFLGVQGAVLLVNLGSFPTLRPAAAADVATELAAASLLVPVRDEAATLPETLPRLLRQGAAEVVVLDDGSRDGTPALLAALAAREPRLRVLRGRPLPPGWTGKCWACHQLAAAARGDWLVFTDADVRWEPGALAALLAFRRTRGAGFASVWPRQLLGGLVERLAVPQIDLILLGSLPYPGVARLRAGALSAGNGQLMLFSRAAYAASGGHAAVRDEVLEDVRLGQRAKAAGVRVALALGGDLVATRMYRGAGEVIAGFAKNARAAAGGWGSLVALTALATVAYLAAWPLAGLEPRWLAIGLAGWALRGLADRKAGRSPLAAPLQSLAPLAMWAVLARAASWRGGYVWKGRRYG